MKPVSKSLSGAKAKGERARDKRASFDPIACGDGQLRMYWSSLSGGRRVGSYEKPTFLDEGAALFYVCSNPLRETPLFASTEAVPAVRRTSIGALAQAEKAGAAELIVDLTTRRPENPEMAPQWVEKTESAPGDGMGSECFDPQDPGTRQRWLILRRRGRTSESRFLKPVQGASEMAPQGVEKAGFSPGNGVAFEALAARPWACDRGRLRSLHRARAFGVKSRRRDRFWRLRLWNRSLGAKTSRMIQPMSQVIQP